MAECTSLASEIEKLINTRINEVVDERIQRMLEQAKERRVKLLNQHEKRVALEEVIIMLGGSLNS